MANLTAARPHELPPRTLVWQYLREAGDSGLYVVRVPAHADTEAHDHVFHELVYVESGTAEHETVEGVRKLRPGDVIVIRPQVWHAYRRTRSFGIINCLIDRQAMQRLGGLLGSVQEAFELYRRRPRDPGQAPPAVLHAGPAERSVLAARLETIMAEQRSRANGWQAAAVAALLDTLVLVARLAGLARSGQDGSAGGNGGGAGQSAEGDNGPVVALAQDGKLPGRTEEAVLDVANHIETHFAGAVSLADLAARVHLSCGHLSRSFGRRMGMGIIEYLHRMRAEEACRLLRCTDAPISEVAARVGYDEITYFSRCFRAQIGQSPREYRRAWHGGLRMAEGGLRIV